MKERGFGVWALESEIGLSVFEPVAPATTEMISTLPSPTLSLSLLFLWFLLLVLAASE